MSVVGVDGAHASVGPALGKSRLVVTGLFPGVCEIQANMPASEYPALGRAVVKEGVEVGMVLVWPEPAEEQE